MYDFTNVDPVKCCTWLVLPTVYDESLSYGEQLNKFCKALNELIENNNNIPDYVSEMIQNYITSGAIDEVVRNILASYILNVKYPPKGISPAVGDGSADDTDAIQGCIDYAFNQGGGCVYLPYGKYLSRSLTLRSGVSLVGFDRYSTKIVQRGGDTKPLVSGGNVQNVQIANLTLDGNNEVQTDDLDVVNVLGKDVLLTNLVIKSGYQCLVYNGLGGDLQVSNVVFGGAVKKVAVINGKDSVQFENVKFNELGKIQGECVLEVGASDGTYRFSSKAVAPICIIANGSRNSFECDVINSTNNYVDNGSMNNFNILGVEVKEQLAKGKSNSVGGSVTESISGSKTETIGNGKVENITGSKKETITENKTENITGNREIDIDGTDSVHIDGVSSVNVGGARTEVFGSSRSVGVTGVNTEEYHDTMTETFESKHNVNGTDENNIFTGSIINSANKFEFTSKTNELLIHFPNKDIDLYNISNMKNVKDYGACGDGVTDDTEALQELLNSGEPLFFPSGEYKVTKSLSMTKSNLIIGNREKSIIIQYSTNKEDCIIEVGNRSSIMNIALKFADTIDTTTISEDEFVGIKLIDTPYASQRSGFYNIIISHCGTGVSSLSKSFSNSYINFEITDFSFAGINLQGSTGDYLSNIYVNNGVNEPNTVNAKLKNSVYGVLIKNNDCVTINTLNIEWCSFSGYALCISNSNFSISSIHLEEIEQRGQYRGLTKFENSSGNISILSFFYPWLFTNGTALIELGSTGKINPYYKSQKNNIINIDILNCDGLNFPDATTFPGIEQRGIQYAPDWTTLFRNQSFQNKDYLICINNIEFNAENENDYNAMINPPKNPHGNIDILKLGYVESYGTDKPTYRLCDYHTTFIDNNGHMYLYKTNNEWLQIN